MPRIKNMWTDEELALLASYYPVGGAQLVAARGVKRPLAAIREKANTSGLFLGKEAKKRARAKATDRLVHRTVSEHWKVPDEYIQAADIFQVGYRYFKQFGWGGQHVAA